MGPQGPRREGWSLAGDVELPLLLAPSISASPMPSLALGVCPVAGMPRALSLPSLCKAGCCGAPLSFPTAASCSLVLGREGGEEPLGSL